MSRGSGRRKNEPTDSMIGGHREKAGSCINIQRPGKRRLLHARTVAGQTCQMYYRIDWFGGPRKRMDITGDYPFPWGI